jgi:hypothetical protein
MAVITVMIAATTVGTISVGRRSPESIAIQSKGPLHSKECGGPFLLFSVIAKEPATSEPVRQ